MLEPTSATLLLRLKTDGPPRELAWAEFRRRYAPIIAGFAKKLGVPPQDVDDLIQNVLTAFYAAQPRFVYDPARGRFRGYLRTCVTNLLSKRGKTHIPLDARPIEQIDAPDESVQKAWDETWEREYLQRALDAVRQHYEDNEKFRAFYRVAIEQHDAEAVAADLGMSVQNVYLAKSRCMARLRLTIKEFEENEG